jgi:uncharacterized short protein YbdD (DUF466 family)
MTGPAHADAPHFPVTEDRLQGAPARAAARCLEEGETAADAAIAGGLIARVLATVRRIIGVPDYAAYVRHMTTHHPDVAVLSAGAFAEEQLQAKYSRPGSRCC